MLCDKEQQLSCPDTVCENNGIKFSICEYTFTSEQDSDVTFTGCSDTSNLNCFAPEMASCLFIRAYVNVYGINTTEPAGNRTVVCESLTDDSSTPLPTFSGINTTSMSGTATATLGSASATPSESAANVNQAVFTLLLAFICLLTVSLSRKL